MVSTQHELYNKIIINCRYRNDSEFVQIIRVAHSVSSLSSAYLKQTIERTVMPNHQIEFQAPIDALLEIHEGMAISSIHSDSIPCSELRIVVDTEVNSDKLANFASGLMALAG
jgi:hypothetical protein